MSAVYWNVNWHSRNRVGRWASWISMNYLFPGTLDLLCCSLSQVQMHKRGLCFIKVAQTNDTPRGVSPTLAASLLSALHLWLLFTSTATSLCQTCAFPLRRDKGKITVEILCALLISLFRVNEKASFCTNRSLQEFYWISKTKMFLGTPCPQFTPGWEAKLRKKKKTNPPDTMTSTFPSRSDVLWLCWLGGFEFYLIYLIVWWNPEPFIGFR